MEEGSYLFILGETKDIDMSEHHPNAKAVKKALIKNGYNSLVDRVDFDYTIEVPSRLHFNYNYVFAGDFLHTEVLGKLNKMLSGECYVYNGNIRQITEFFFYVHILKYKGIKLKDPIEKIDECLYGKWRIRPCRLLDVFEINKNDIIRYLERYFFHPDYKRYSMKLMSDLSLYGHSRDRAMKKNGNGYHNHYLKTM